MSTDCAAAINATADSVFNELRELSLRIHQNPEIRFQEKKASAWLAQFLESHGFDKVELGVGGLETAFKTSLPVNGWQSPSDGPTIAIICEYDALPGVGHACGHNIIAAAGAGAAVTSALVAKQGFGSQKWRLQCIGTPAEEGGGGKVLLIDAGVFKDVDAAMMVHPFSEWSSFRPLLGIHRLACEFRGKASHASSEPWSGVNALDAVVAMYNSVSMMRQQIRPSARIHGIITKGGDAANIIPEFASCEFYVRSEDLSYLEELLQRVRNCAQAAALATGCSVSMRFSNPSYLPMKHVPSFVDTFQRNVEPLIGEPCPTILDTTGSASSDIGNVSQILPTIHPWVKITPDGKKPALHSHEFAECAASDVAFQTMINCAKAMAKTTFDLALDQALMQKVKAEFDAASRV